MVVLTHGPSSGMSMVPCLKTQTSAEFTCVVVELDAGEALSSETSALQPGAPRPWVRFVSKNVPVWVSDG